MTKNDCLQTRRAIFLMLSLVLLVAILPFASALKWNGVSALGNLTFDNTGTPLLNTGIGTFPTTNFGMVAGSYSCIDGNCLNASAGYGEITYNTLATDGTICMWSRFDKNTSLSGNQCIIVDDVDGANQGDFSLGFQGCNGYGSGGALTLEFNKAGGGVAQVSTPQTNFVKDNWYHICIRVASSRYGKIFINGSEVASLDAGGTTIGMFGTGAVGVFFGTTTEHLNATIDEFKYFNSALSDANILDMYQTELSSVTVSLNTPIDNDVVSSSSVNYNCSATTSGVLSNISLWTNSTGIWHRNQTIARTGTANETVFSSTISQTTLPYTK